MDHNLNEIIQFQNYLRSTLQATYSDVSEHRFAAATIANYEIRLRELSFLNLYAYLEEYFYLLWRTRAKDIPRSDSNSIQRYRPVVEHLNRDHLPPQWSYILDMTEIRHCLMHANGRISFMKNPNRIAAIIGKYEGQFSIEHGDRLRVEIDSLAEFVRNIRELRDEIESAT